ncbi:MAG: low-specificity L-threonine aldolase [Calditrichaeota bacterium]|nr:low-specificity L-threonine aldolase [Calditrichota bacterium]
MIDLRSDTLTQPDEGMRQAMAAAEVGDDVFGEDPTVNLLQKKIAELTGKDAALFVCSGTMANQISINAHTQPGDEVICEERAHIFNYEAGAPAMLSGVQVRPLPGKYGVLDVTETEEAIRPSNHHFPQTRLIALENTHNRWGGTIYPLDEIKKMRKLAKKNDLKMHLDGARLWNASVATGISLKEFAKHFDSVSLCFSKGLGAPIGSVVAGDEEFIDRAHYYRKAYGGGMRQAGILAAAALYAIENNFERMAEDHRRARVLAEAINEMPGFVVNLLTVQTNIVIIDTSLTGHPAPEIADKLLELGVRVLAFAQTRIRMVTHLHITDKDIDRTIEAFKKTSHSIN